MLPATLSTVLCVHWHHGTFSWSESALWNGSDSKTFSSVSSSCFLESCVEEEVQLQQMGSCYGPWSFLSSGEMVMHLSICVTKLEKKHEHGSTGLSRNPEFQMLFGAYRSLLAILFFKLTSCNLESARPREAPFLSCSPTKGSGRFL